MATVLLEPVATRIRKPPHVSHEAVHAEGVESLLLGGYRRVNDTPVGEARSGRAQSADGADVHRSGIDRSFGTTRDGSGASVVLLT